MKFKVLLLAVVATACATEFDPGERPQFWNGTNTLTLHLFDGQTGVGITNAQVRVQVGPALLLAASEGNNIYTVSQIPPGTYQVLVSAPDYLDFVGTRQFSGGGSLDDHTPNRYYLTNTVTLFPLKKVEQDIVVRVYESETGATVSAGQVVASLDPNESVASPMPTLADPLVGDLGYLPRTLSVTLADGVATLPADQLVFGATYELSIVGARDADGRYLSPLIREVSVQAGLGFPTAVVFVGPPAIEPVALSANNENEDVLVPNLVVRFPYPVELCGAPDDRSWTNLSPDTDGDTERTTPAEDEAVKATFAEDGAVLTLLYVADPDDLDDSLVVRFSGIAVQVAGSTKCYDLDDVSLRGSNQEVSLTIPVREAEVN